jgi:uncharacterized coiled-coil protein SlyX
MVRCLQTGCEWVGRVDDQLRHSHECQYLGARDVNECSVEIIRRSRNVYIFPCPAHTPFYPSTPSPLRDAAILEQVCMLNVIPCTLGCGLEIARGLMMEHTDAICPLRSTSCPNGCDLSLPHRDLPLHCDTACPLRIVTCPLSAMGSCSSTCQGRLQYQDLESHMLSPSAQACGWVSVSRVLMEHRLRIEALEQTTAQQQVTIATQERIIASQGEAIASLRSELDRIRSELFPLAPPSSSSVALPLPLTVSREEGKGAEDASLSAPLTPTAVATPSAAPIKVSCPHSTMQHAITQASLL